jgi:putative transposase
MPRLLIHVSPPRRTTYSPFATISSTASAPSAPPSAFTTAGMSAAGTLMAYSCSPAPTGPDTRADLVDRTFTATAPERLWVADITSCRTFTGWVDAALMVGVFSRGMLGWQLSTSLRTDVALDAWEMGIWTRRRDGRDAAGVTLHSDMAVQGEFKQYLAVRYTQRLADAGARASVVSTGDASDNLLAEAFNSLFNAELVRSRDAWTSIDDLEIAVAEYIDWFDHRRVHGKIGLIPPAEHEGNHHRHNPAPATARASVASLH